MAEFSYRTIATAAQGQYREKGSRFLAYAWPVEREDQIRQYLADLQKEHFDARHHCYAWMLGADGKLFRAYDAGEPNHSAGDPILGQIRSRALTNVLVVVVRYFGGTKLGVGGLISAYKQAASAALDNAAIVEKDLVKSVTITYDYAATPEVMKLVKDFDLVIDKQSFDAQCTLVASCKLKRAEALTEKAKLMLTLGHITGFTAQ